MTAAAALKAEMNESRNVSGCDYSLHFKNGETEKALSETTN